MHKSLLSTYLCRFSGNTIRAFRLNSHMPRPNFDGDMCSTSQVILAVMKQLNSYEATKQFQRKPRIILRLERDSNPSDLYQHALPTEL